MFLDFSVLFVATEVENTTSIDFLSFESLLRICFISLTVITVSGGVIRTLQGHDLQNRWIIWDLPHLASFLALNALARTSMC